MYSLAYLKRTLFYKCNYSGKVCLLFRRLALPMMILDDAESSATMLLFKRDNYNGYSIILLVI